MNMEAASRSGAQMFRRLVAPALPHGAKAQALDFYTPPTSVARVSSITRAHAVALTCGVWFIVALAGIVWSWQGQDPKYFSSPDEAMNRQAAGLVATTGAAQLELSDEDPEDLRFGRFWISVGDHAISSYPPVAYYLQGLLLLPPKAGALLIAALSALGIAAFAGAVALLAQKRTWVALIAPAAAFPGLYWLMRPWMNMSTFLVFVCCAFFCWAAWRRAHAKQWLFAAAAMVGVSAAVRPDYAPFVFALSLIALYAEERSGERKRAVIALALSAAFAVVINLVLNALTTGEPLTAAYEIVDERRGGEIGGGLPGPLSKLGFLLLPYGVPSFSTITGQIDRYWLDMGPMVILSLGSTVAVGLLMLQASRRQRFALGASVVVCALFVLTHLSDSVYGATQPTALLRHSVTRYWAPVYLLAAVPLLMLATSRMREGTWVAALAALCALAVLGGREIYSEQPESLSDLRAMQERQASMISQWDELLPDDAVVYSYNLDKMLWPHWEIGTLAQNYDHEASAASVDRTLASGRDVYVVQVVWPTARYLEGLNDALAARDLRMTPVGGSEDVYRVRRAIPEEANKTLRSR
jgi:hypothetical protein